MPIMIDFSRAEKRQLRIGIQRDTDAGPRTRMSILPRLARGRPAAQVADSPHLARSTVYRVAERFRSQRFTGLADRREDNGRPGVDEEFPLTLRQVVAGWPHDYGWARPTWTEALLGVVLADIVHDLFVAAKYGHEVIDRVRVDEANRLKHDRPARRVIKGSRWLLLRNAENLRRE